MGVGVDFLEGFDAGVDFEVTAVGVGFEVPESVAGEVVVGEGDRGFVGGGDEVSPVFEEGGDELGGEFDLVVGDLVLVDEFEDGEEEDGFVGGGAEFFRSVGVEVGEAIGVVVEVFGGHDSAIAY